MTLLSKLEAATGPSLSGQFNAPRIIVSDHALEETDERLFPVSKHRSARLHKKLLKRHGGEFRKVPCIFKTPLGFIAHPTRYAELKAAIQ